MPKLAQASLAKMPPEFIVSTAMTLLRSSEQLKKCDPLSIVHCVVQSAQTGLRLDPVLQQAALVPRWNSQRKRLEAQFMPMYRGLLLLSRRSGQIVHVAAQPVYAADTFIIEYGSEQKLIHRPELDWKKREVSQILRYYAYIKLSSGGFQFEMMSQDEINEVKAEALSDKKNKDASPWTTDPIPMALKTVLRKLLKLAPVSDPMLSAALLSDDLLDRGITQNQVIENGLVVPGASFKEESIETTPPTKVETVKEEPKQEPTKMDPKQWLQNAIIAIEAKGRVQDKSGAQALGREAKAMLDRQELTQVEFDKVVAAFVAAFPPPPQPALFDGSGAPAEAPTPERKPPVAERSTPEPAPASKPEAKVKSEPKKAKTVSLAATLMSQVEEASKVSVLLTIKGRIEKGMLTDQERDILVGSLNAKLTQLTGGKK
jgi:recombination protein RecT